MTSPAQWIHGARPRTLPAAIAPVVAGTAVAHWQVEARWVEAVLALTVALALQIAVNYANDYSDGVRGTDQVRVGPMRLVASGAASAAAVKRAMLLSLMVAALAGLALCWLSGHWWLVAVGAACAAAAWYYTGGSRPYGYAGWGEVMVFIFFGLVAVLGTTFTQTGLIDVTAVLVAVLMGAWASAILVANNLRDRPRDALTGKHTLAVKMGDGPTRWLYVILVGCTVPVAVTLAALTNQPWPLAGLLAVVFIAPSVAQVLRGASDAALIPVLGKTGMGELLCALLISLGLILSR